MQELLKQKIAKIEMNEQADSLVFTTKDGEEIAFSAYGDCCSLSWFAHIAGIKNLIGQTVTLVDDSKFLMPQAEAEKEGDYESLAIYGFDLHTKKGICTIEFRNDSNGYYGGDCEISIRQTQDKYKEIKEDF